MFPGEEPELFLARAYQVYRRHAGCRHREIGGEIVQIIVRQLSDNYDVEKRSFLSSSDITRAFIEHTIRTSYANGNVKELKKPQLPSAAAAAPRNPHVLTVGGFRQSRGGGSGDQWSGGGGFPAGELDSGSFGPAGVAVSSRNSSNGITGGMASSSSSSMVVGIANIGPSSLCRGNRTSSICHATSIVVPLIGSNASVHRRNIHTCGEDQSLGLEGRGSAERTPRGTKKNHLS